MSEIKQNSKGKPNQRRSRDSNWSTGGSKRIHNYTYQTTQQNNVNNRVAKGVVQNNIPKELKPFILRPKSVEEALDITKMLWKDNADKDFDPFVKAMRQECMLTKGGIGNEINGIRYAMVHQEPALPDYAGLTADQKKLVTI